MEVRVDGVVTPAHTVVEREGRIVVSFRVEPGDHSVVVTSGPRSPSPGKQAIRVVHFSAKVKVTEDKPATAVSSTKMGGGEAYPGGRPTRLGRGYSAKAVIRDGAKHKPRDRPR
jgi:hypothetical protein